MTRHGAGRFQGFSAGSAPGGQVHPLAIEVLQSENYDTSGLRSKSWDEFEAPGAPKLDFVFTVCDNAANETCPVWPGQPVSAHWGLPDPSSVEGSDADKRSAFAQTYRVLYQRIGLFVNLPFDSLDQLTLKQRLNELGHTAPETPGV